MSEAFTCPNCGAPQTPPDGPKTSVECPYCGHTVVVPLELRQQPPAQPVSTYVIDLRDGDEQPNHPARQTNRRILTWLVVGIAAVVILSILVPLAFIPLMVKPAFDSMENAFEAPTIQEITVPPEFQGLLPATAEPGFAAELFSFGSEGIGAGRFKDARSIGLDSEGRIYVAEYLDGRVQVFDPQGAFITQWQVDGELPVRALAVGRDGVVNIVQGGQILRYQGPQGQILDSLPYQDGFDDVFATLDGGLLTAFYRGRDDIIRFDSAGEQVLYIEEAISGQSGDSELDMNVAEDGQGKIYALGSFNEALFIYNAQGKFLNQLGSEGDEPGQFRAMHDVVVDGQGRIYVSDFKGVQVFAPDGRYLGLIDIDESAFGLEIDDQDNLYVAARTKVYKFQLNSDF